MITGGTGGANTLTGLIYEGKVDLKTFLNNQHGYRVVGSTVIYPDEEVAQIFQKYELYSEFLVPRGVDWKNCYLPNYYPIMVYTSLSITPYS